MNLVEVCRHYLDPFAAIEVSTCVMKVQICWFRSTDSPLCTLFDVLSPNGSVRSLQFHQNHSHCTKLSSRANESKPVIICHAWNSSFILSNWPQLNHAMNHFGIFYKLLPILNSSSKKIIHLSIHHSHAMNIDFMCVSLLWFIHQIF